MAVIAVDAGVRAEIWVIAVPSCIDSVCEPHQASGVKQSDPYASLVHIEVNPSSSATAICSAASGGGSAAGPVADDESEVQVVAHGPDRSCDAELERVLVFGDVSRFPFPVPFGWFCVGLPRGLPGRRAPKPPATGVATW